MRASASDLGIYGSEPVCGPESRVGLGAALIDPDEAGGSRPESSKRKSKITIKKMIMSKRKIKRMIRFAPVIAAIKRNVACEYDQGGRTGSSWPVWGKNFAGENLS